MTNTRRGNRRRLVGLAAVTALAAAVLVATGSPTAAAGCVVDTDDVIGWWPGEGDLTAQIGPDLTGSTGFVPAKVGQGMSFDGTNDVQTAVFPAVSSQVTVETWFSTTFNGTAQALVSRWGANSARTDDDSYTLWVTVGDQLVWQTEADAGSGQTFTIAVRPEIYDGQLHHAAGTWDGTWANLYLDGQLVASSAVSGQLNPALGEPLRLGRFGTQPFPLSGVLDEATVFSRALSATEIADIHAAGSDGKCGSTPTDTTPPSATIVTPADGSTHLLGSTVLADYACQDEVGGSGLASCLGTVADGAVIDTTTIGTNIFTVTATDNALNQTVTTANYNVIYPFGGFVSPVDPLPTVNSLKAGQAVPVRFSLGGDRGLAVLAVGYPKSETIPCSSSAQVDGIEETASSGSSGLSYDSSTDTYSYTWKTGKEWKNTCRQLVVRLVDGASYRANFMFK